MGMETWHGMFEFCHTARCRVVFSVNALHGRARVPCETATHCHDRIAPACCTEWQGTWSSDNLRSVRAPPCVTRYLDLSLQFQHQAVF